MKCAYCGSRDENRLMMSTRAVNGRVVTIDICLSCYWIDRFKVAGEYAILREERFEDGLFAEADPSAAGMD